ncbi:MULTISPECIES: FKBP-type peptidyl-prolyl cis-trans isomerase [Catenuloplanes]|uniref:peptidylprolyl isomerase n=1 Tax=Catenuloplanes niger TaxID=587534 RepID=A0AAE3ZKK3_9ACTN|nr:FKBP-type peptidyl-prolyl cis-trans isomerase [Catenuloplanes niger]MDR7321633.1 peptidylprolyl isomerase [Catenuloplanes niger]
MSDPVGTEKSETTAPKQADVIDTADKDQAEGAAPAAADGDRAATADDAGAGTADKTVAADKTAAAEGADAAKADVAGGAEDADGEKTAAGEKAAAGDGETAEDGDADKVEGADKAEEARPLTKAEKRELLRIQTQRARARKAGRQAFGLAVIGLAVVAVIVGAVYFADSRSEDPVAEASAAPTAPAEEPSQPPAVPFPPVPAGADPALSTKPVVEKGAGKLEAGKPKITYVIKGTGPATKEGDLITANYVGVLYGTGEEFDSSWSRQEAIEFTIGMGQLIDGWEQGLMNVPVGSRIILDLPPDLAYGDQDDGSGRPTGDLRFVVDVLNAQGQ